MQKEPSDKNAAAGAPAEKGLVINKDGKNSFTRKGYALLIGVEDYSAHDPSGRANLFAGRNDVLAYWQVCRRLGYPLENIHMYTSPILTKEDIVNAEMEVGPEVDPDLFKGSTRGEHEERVRAWVEEKWGTMLVAEVATAEKLLKGFQWLATNLLITSQGIGENGREVTGVLAGFLAYSGHGAQVGDDLALCPSDVGPSLENALAFEQIWAIFRRVDEGESRGFDAWDKLTVVLDCCFAARAQEGGHWLAQAQENGGVRVTTLSKPSYAQIPGEPRPKREIGRRVFCASKRDEKAYQAVLGGHWHGAFTWALTVALEQWKMTPSGPLKRSTMSHVELLFRARMLLDSLSFKQHPILVDELANMPVFDDDEAVHTTDADPNALRLVGQLQPDTKYVITGTNVDITAYVLSKQIKWSPDGTVFPAEAPTVATEYWFDNIDWAAFSNAPPTSISITPESITYTTNQTKPLERRTYNCPSDAGSWGTPPVLASNETAYYFTDNADAPTMALQLITNGTTTTGVVWWANKTLVSSTNTITLTEATWKKGNRPSDTPTVTWVTKKSK